MAEYSDKGYGKRPMWQWILIYIVIGGIIYAAAYYLFLGKGGYNYPGSNTSQNSTQQSSPGY